MTQYFSLDPESLWVNTTMNGTPYINAELTDQYDDTDHENIEFAIGRLDAVIVRDFMIDFVERYGK